MAGIEDAVLVALGDQHQGAVEGIDLVEEDGDVHRAGLGHAVVTSPSAVVLVPLPDIAGELGLRVDLELVHVDLFAEHLLQRFDEPGVAAEDREGLVIGVGGEGGARRAGGFAPDFLAVLGVDLFAFLAQNRDFFR